MKPFYLFLLFLFSHQSYAQWSLVGSNLGSTSGNTGVSLAFNPSTNEAYDG